MQNTRGMYNAIIKIKCKGDNENESDFFLHRLPDRIMSQAHQAPEIVIYAVTLLFGLVPAALM